MVSGWSFGAVGSLSRIVNTSVALISFFGFALAGDLCRDQLAVADDLGVLGRGFLKPDDVALGHDEHVRRRMGIDVFENEHLVVLVDLLRGNFAGDDLAEKAVIHKGDGSRGEPAAQACDKDGGWPKSPTPRVIGFAIVANQVTVGAPGLAPFETWVSTTQDSRTVVGALSMTDSRVSKGARPGAPAGHSLVHDSFGVRECVGALCP